MSLFDGDERACAGVVMVLLFYPFVLTAGIEPGTSFRWILPTAVLLGQSAAGGLPTADWPNGTAVGKSNEMRYRVQFPRSAFPAVHTRANKRVAERTASTNAHLPPAAQHRPAGNADRPEPGLSFR